MLGDGQDLPGHNLNVFYFQVFFKTFIYPGNCNNEICSIFREHPVPTDTVRHLEAPSTTTVLATERLTVEAVD